MTDIQREHLKKGDEYSFSPLATEFNYTSPVSVRKPFLSLDTLWWPRVVICKH